MCFDKQLTFFFICLEVSSLKLLSTPDRLCSEFCFYIFGRGGLLLLILGLGTVKAPKDSPEPIEPSIGLLFGVLRLCFIYLLFFIVL